MAERKVISKYNPPDFDPSRIPRPKKATPTVPRIQLRVHLASPFSMCCNTCGEYIAKDRKFFNARKEAPEDKYSSIQIYRLYIRCSRCSAEITFKTDPENAGYVCESGAKQTRKIKRRIAEEEGEEGQYDVLANMELKARVAKVEMDIADALERVRDRNARIERRAVAAQGDLTIAQWNM